MQYAVRGSDIVVFRILDEGSEKRRDAIGTLDKETLAPSRRLESNLTEEERPELKAYIQYRSRVRDVRGHFAALILAENLDLAANWIEYAEHDLAKHVADEVLLSWARFRAALTRSGLV